MLVYLTFPYSATIVSAELIKETPKRFYLNDKSGVLIRGDKYFKWIPRQVDKDSHRYKVFTDLAAANQCCLDILRREEARLVGALEKVRAEIAQWEAA